MTHDNSYSTRVKYIYYRFFSYDSENSRIQCRYYIDYPINIDYPGSSSSRTFIIDIISIQYLYRYRQSINYWGVKLRDHATCMHHAAT